MTALNAAPRSKPAAAQWLVLGALAAAVATAAVLIVLAPVSYTHLDVYKRQAWRSISREWCVASWPTRR